MWLACTTQRGWLVSKVKHAQTQHPRGHWCIAGVPQLGEWPSGGGQLDTAVSQSGSEWASECVSRAFWSVYVQPSILPLIRFTLVVWTHCLGICLSVLSRAAWHRLMRRRGNQRPARSFSGCGGFRNFAALSARCQWQWWSTDKPPIRRTIRHV